ncbi:MAG: hypothetical protein FWE29_05360 [Defluviitaleaceae bacterium]|nr:hypothetical protein [Defluviitaleaceae bacterium]
MKKTLKKIISIMLTAMFILPMIPVVEVFADSQLPIGTGVHNGNFHLIHDNTDNVSFAPSYRLEASWNDHPGQTEHFGLDMEYRIHFRRDTLATSAADPWVPVTSNAAGIYDRLPISVNLNPGSIYAFRVDGRHAHPNPNWGQPGQPMYINLPWAIGQQVLFLTDIRVEATGRGHELTVTWDNPRLNGQDLFTGYNIYLVRRAPGTALSNPSLIYMQPSSIQFVSMDDPNLEHLAGNRLRFTIDDPVHNIEPFYLYDIAVMPMVGSVPLRGDRDQAGVSNIVFNDTPFPIVYPASPRGALGHVRPYFVGGVAVEFPLTVTDLMDGHIRLQWGSPRGNVTEIQIYERVPGENATRIVTLHGPNIQNNFYILPRPDSPREYQVRIILDDGTVIPVTIESNWTPFNPAAVDFLPYRPNIIHSADSPSFRTNPLAIDFEWRAFTRRPLNDAEVAASINGLFVDPNVVFDIWITDDFELLHNPGVEPIVSRVGPNLITVPGRTDPFVYSTIGNNIFLTQFATQDANGMIHLLPLEDNTAYFIRIEARMADDETKVSPSSYGTIYIPPIDGVTATPVMLTSPPLRVVSEATTSHSITIEWDARWYEIYNNDNRTWHSEAWLLNGDIVFTRPTSSNAVQLLPLDRNSITDPGFPNVGRTLLRELLGVALYDITPIRHMELRPDVEYVLHTAQYGLVANNDFPGSDDPFMAYIYHIIGRNVNRPINEWVPPENVWTPPIQPEGSFPSFRYTVTTQQNPAGSLVENMPYLIFLRPVLRPETNSIFSYFPAFVSETTLREDRDLIITPTVPILEDAGRAPMISSLEGPSMNVQATDTTITVRWEGSFNLTYTLRHGRLQADFPGAGYPPIEIDPRDPPEGFMILTDPNTEIMYFYYTLSGLFPETDYFIWIRAEAEGSPPSAWSNPLLLATREMEVPPIPQGLGIASAESVRTFNEESNATLTPVGENHLILEWLLNSNDPGPRATSSSVTGGNADFLQNPRVPATYMAIFRELLPFTEYYARIKTVATITREGQGSTVLTHSYVLQLSLTEDFVDAIEITIPPLVEITAANAPNIRRRESDWSETIRIVSGRTSGEFDGDRNPELYPLPQDDFEITYNHATRTLNYRFRSNRIGADGNRDNNVDQRFISRLVNNRVFTFDLDLTNYQNYTIANRVIEIPYSIISAFDERRISLRAKMGDIYVTLPPGSIMTPEVLALRDLGEATVRISMDATGTRVPVLPTGSLFATQPQRLSVQIVTPTRTLDLAHLARPINLSMIVNQHLATPNRQIGGFIAPESALAWEAASGARHNAQDGIVTFETTRIASFSAIATAAPTVTATAPGGQAAPASNAHQSAMSIVNSRVTITDMPSINMNATINANQFNRIIEAVVSNRPSVTINQPLTTAQHQSLGRSGMLVSGVNVSREAGIASLVRLYEVQTRTAVRNFPTEQTTAHPDIRTATAAHRQGLLKAEHLGFFNTTNVNPSGGLTFGEFFRILSYVIEDSAQ